jgi:predicted aspartyl protease
MKVETSFELVGDLIGVDAVITGPTGRVEVQLILDTGAVMTTIVPSIAESVGYSPASRLAWMVTRTAAAEERGYIVRSDVDVLGFTVPGLRIAVADLGYGIDGVLGMDFLRLFNIEIRPIERRIVLVPLTAV